MLVSIDRKEVQGGIRADVEERGLMIFLSFVRVDRARRHWPMDLVGGTVSVFNTSISSITTYLGQENTLRRERRTVMY